MNYIFIHPKEVKENNKTLLVLIPKVDIPEHVKQLKPISLYNVIYKAITKIITLILKVCMTTL